MEKNNYDSKHRKHNKHSVINTCVAEFHTCRSTPYRLSLITSLGCLTNRECFALSASISVCLSFCLSLCRYVSVCLPVCMYVRLPACLSSNFDVCWLHHTANSVWLCFFFSKDICDCSDQCIRGSFRGYDENQQEFDAKEDGRRAEVRLEQRRRP